MKVTTDACLFGAWTTEQIKNEKLIITNCLDIGTGTGLLPLLLSQKISALNFDAVEIDKDSFEQAKENIAASPWAGRIKVIHADARDLSSENKYAIIISNPPFYENELKGDNKKKNIAHHSDDLSLSELLKIIKNNLSTDGTFYLLLPYKRNEEIKKLIRETGLFIQQIIFVRQSVNHDFSRFMIAGKLKADESNETMINEITIRDEEQQYTDGFKNLLRDYYLHL